jgi:hypothetical protein
MVHSRWSSRTRNPIPINILVNLLKQLKVSIFGEFIFCQMTIDNANQSEQTAPIRKNLNSVIKIVSVALGALVMILFFENSSLRNQIKTKNDQLLSQINANSKLRADLIKLKEIEEEADILRAKLSELNKKENDRRKEEIRLEIRDLQQQLVYEKVKLKDISEFHFLRTAEEKRTQIQNQVSIIQDIQKQLQDLNNQLNSLN